jgi:hypothetical protein
MYAYSTHADIYPENSLVVHWYYSLEKVGSLCHGEQVHWHVSTGGGEYTVISPLEARWYQSPRETLVSVIFTYTGVCPLRVKLYHLYGCIPWRNNVSSEGTVRYNSSARTFHPAYFSQFHLIWNPAFKPTFRMN